jgi:predicted dehydrogenase
MAVFDDMELERKLTIYEKSATPRTAETYGEYVHVRFGDILCPRVSNEEPLRVECEHFISAIRSTAEFPAGGREGLAVVRVLEALQRSLEQNGMPQAVGGHAAGRMAGVVELPVRSA